MIEPRKDWHTPHLFRLSLLLLVVFMTGCETLKQLHPATPVSEPKAQSELDALFAQPYIDPLTRYLETNRRNAELTNERRLVRQERDRRCQVIADQFARRAVTADSVDRFRRGYTYSCPEAVKAFADQLSRQPETPPTTLDVTTDSPEIAPIQTPIQAPSTAIEPSPLHPQASECYLLTSIKNYAEALQACEAPATASDHRAQANMAKIYYELKRYELTLKWAKIAADSSADAAFLMGKLYEQGQAVERNLQEALSWYQYAQQMGHAQAGAEGLRLSREMQ